MHPTDDPLLSPDPGLTAADAPAGAAPAEALFACLGKALGHELPNHFVAIQGLARVLEWEELDRLSNDGKNYLRRLAGAAERAHGLIRTLADVIRARGGLRAGELVPVAEVAREAVTEATQLLPERRVDYDLGGAGVVLPVPRLALRQVLVQLIRNAVQATARAEVPRIALGARDAPPDCEFWVTDHGRGFAAEQRAALDDFLAGRTAALGGGFGLLFVRLVVDSWGGRLCVASEPGRGCTMTVTLRP